MTSGSDRVDVFIDQAGWAKALRSPIAADLSVRRYTRLTRANGDTAILMDAPANDPSNPAFAAMTHWLRQAHLSAPEILHSDISNGLLLLEDLGTAKVAEIARDDPTLRDEVDDTILDLLILLRAQVPPDLPCADASDLVAMTRLAEDFLPGVNVAGLKAFRRCLETELAVLLDDSISTSLRDFHTDNLLWLPERNGVARLGLLDYQDAFLTHPVYDLVSFVTDARIDVPADRRRRLIGQYAARSGDDLDALHRAFAVVSAQRNLRILAIFARAAQKHGKSMHLDKMPRVYDYFTEALQHPVFAAVAEETRSAVPLPTTAEVRTAP